MLYLICSMCYTVFVSNGRGDGVNLRKISFSNFKCESRVEQELGKSGSNAAKDMTKQARQGADQGGGLDVR